MYHLGREELRRRG